MVRGKSDRKCLMARSNSQPNVVIILADDHNIVRQGLKSLIEKELGLEVVGEADNGRTTVSLAAELENDLVNAFKFQHIQDIFRRDWLKVKRIRHFVIGADSFRIIIDHDGFVAKLLCCHDTVHAAIIKFNALADADRAGTDDRDFFSTTRAVDIRLIVPGGIEIICRGAELRRTGIDHPVSWSNFIASALAPNFSCRHIPYIGHLLVAKAKFFRLQQTLSCNVMPTDRTEVLPFCDDIR